MNIKKLCYIFCVCLLFTDLYAEETYEKISFDFSTAVNLPTANFQSSAGAESKFFEVFSGIKTENFSQVENPRNLNFSIQSFGLRFSPLLIRRKKTVTPCVSFFFGKLNYNTNFAKLCSNTFSKPKYGKNIALQKNGSFKLSKSALPIDFGFECAMEHFAFNYLASKNKELDCFSHAVFLSAKTEDLTERGHGFYLAAYAGFSPSKLNKIAHSTTRSKNTVPFYNQVYGTTIQYVNEYFGIEGNIAASKNSNHKSAVSGSLSIQNYWERFTVKIGTSINSKNFIGWKNNFPSNTLSFYVSPVFAYDILTLQAFYNLERSGLKRTENYIRGKEKLYHSAGGKIILKDKSFKTELSLEYAQTIYSVYFITALYFPKRAYMKKMEVKTAFDVQNKKINPYCVKKYGFDAKIAFAALKNLSIDVCFLYSQENKSKKKKIDGILCPVIEWQAYQIAGTAQMSYSLKRNKYSNKFSLGIKVCTDKPHYAVELGYSCTY